MQILRHSDIVPTYNRRGHADYKIPEDFNYYSGYVKEKDRPMNYRTILIGLGRCVKLGAHRRNKEDNEPR